MLAYGLISPHPPIILPEVGGTKTKQVRRTIDALDNGIRQLAAAEPEALIIISPHEDHGFEVPEYFLQKQLPGEMPLEEILVTEASYEYYYEYGKSVGARIAHENKRYAIVASGDLSHVLKADGPYGYHASGPKLDEIIVRAVQERDMHALLGIDPTLLDEGAECGLRSILFLLGAFEASDAEAKVLSYEGPFGVGYLVATFAPKAPDETDGKIITGLARKAIKHYLKTGRIQTTPHELPESLRRRAGAFVSLHEKSGALRGCIGTIAATKSTLAGEIIANAISSATQDPRFPPIELVELDQLRISVDVLGNPVPELDPAKLDPKKYGVIVAAADGRRGVLLPDIEGVDTVAEQLDICRDKGGIRADEPVEVSRFEVARYLE